MAKIITRKQNMHDRLAIARVQKKRIVAKLQADLDLCTTKQMEDRIRRERFGTERFITASFRYMSDQDVALVYLLTGILSLWQVHQVKDNQG